MMSRLKSFTFDEEVDAAYASLSALPVARTVSVENEIVVDYDVNGEPVGVEVLNVRRRIGSADLASYLEGLVDGVVSGGRAAAE